MFLNSFQRSEVFVKAMDAVLTAARRAGVGVTEIGELMGKSKTYVSATAGRGSTPRADTLAKMLSVCGYALYAVPAENVPDDAIEIDPM